MNESEFIGNQQKCKITIVFGAISVESEDFRVWFENDPTVAVTGTSVYFQDGQEVFIVVFSAQNIEVRFECTHQNVTIISDFFNDHVHKLQ